MVPFGIRLYGLGAMALGLVGLVWGDFALQWQPVAAWVPVRTLLAYLFSAALVIAGAGANDLIPMKARAGGGASRQLEPGDGAAANGAAALAGLYALVVILMHGPQLFLHPTVFAVWNGAAEQLALLAGGVAAYSCLSGPGIQPGARLLGRAAVVAMGVCLLMFGVAHFLYLDFTASMVPAWLPGGQKFWAAATGVGHIAAGVALLSGVKARLAAIALTLMFAAFGVLVHLPLLLADPRAHLSWVMNAINLALTGAAWAVTTYLAGARADWASVQAAP
jgi:uncharacterized membrane protein YphA (DoxX/SURF4 family)